MDQISAAGGTDSAFLFLQGESDANNKDRAQAWRGRFEQMLAGPRAQFGPDFPVILAEIGNLDSGDFPYQAIVHAEPVGFGPAGWHKRDLLAIGAVEWRLLDAHDHDLEQDSARGVQPDDRRKGSVHHALD
jgi:hypothetical protein